MRPIRLAALLLSWAPALVWGADVERPIAPVPGLESPLNVAGGGVLRGPVANSPVGPLVPAVFAPEALALPTPLVPADALVIPQAPFVGVEIGPAPASAELGSKRDRHDEADRNALKAIEDWSAQQAEPASRGDLAGEESVGDGLFDATRAAQTESFTSPLAGILPQPAAVALPRGVSGVTVEEAGDAGIGRHLRYLYHTPLGKDVVGIDLLSRPELVDQLPDLKPWERHQIKMIQSYTRDLRVLVLENTGKTPDLEVGGVITELKTWPIDKMDLAHIINKANSQVSEHAARHGLGKGAAVVEVADRDVVPTAQILAALNAWAALPSGSAVRGKFKEATGWVDGEEARPKEPANLDRITFFAGRDVKVFARVKNSYRLLPDAQPFGSFATSGLAPISRAKPLAQARTSAIADAYEKARLLGDLRAFRERGRRKKAFKAWEKFQQTHRSEVVEAVRAEAEAILERILKDAQKEKRLTRGRGGRGGR